MGSQAGGADIAAGNFSLVRTAVGDGPDGTGANKLWLPLWSGEVINAYDQYNVFENMITTKSLTGGFTYEFPMTGTVDLKSSWDAGVELIGGSSTSTSIKVQLDNRPMAAHFETDNIDMLITQWDYRSELARQAGLQLANTRDRQVAMSLLAACAVQKLGTDARGIAAAAFQDPGMVATNVLASGTVTDTQGLLVLQEIENYLVTCQENDISIGNVYCAVTPKVFQVIRALGIPRTATATGLSYTGPVFGASDSYGGLGAPLSAGMNALTDSLDYMGVKIIKTNHLPKVDHNVGNNIGSAKYNLNAGASSFATTNGTGFINFSVYGIIFQTEAVAGLSLQGMKVDTVQDVRRNTQFTVASMLKGTGLIRPEMCKALISGAAPTAGTPVTTAGREGLRNHLNGNLASGTAVHANLTNGFSAEYAQA